MSFALVDKAKAAYRWIQTGSITIGGDCYSKGTQIFHR